MVTAISGRLIAKIQRQESWSMSRPPSSGPATKKMPVQAVQVPTAAPRSSPSKQAVMIASELGTSSAPATPCRVRPAMSRAELGAIAQIAEVTAKPPSPTRKMRRRPSRSPSEPPTNSSDESVSRYASTTHCWVARPACRSSRRAGSATFTTLPSRNTTPDPRMDAIRVSLFLSTSMQVDSRCKYAGFQMDSDVVVVGAGILGLATARELLARHPESKVLVLEREDQVGFHQTGHNSG